MDKLFWAVQTGHLFAYIYDLQESLTLEKFKKLFPPKDENDKYYVDLFVAFDRDYKRNFIKFFVDQPKQVKKIFGKLIVENI